MKEEKCIVIFRGKNRTAILLNNLLWIASLVFACYLNYRFIGNSTLLMLAIVVTWFLVLLTQKVVKNFYSKSEAIKHINEFFDEK